MVMYQNLIKIFTHIVNRQVVGDWDTVVVELPVQPYPISSYMIMELRPG